MNDLPGKPWNPDFPEVMRFLDHNNAQEKSWHLLTAHPYYDAAKNHENRMAAARVIRDIMETRTNQAQLRMLKQKYPDAIVVPVHAVEAKGKNRLPEAFADYIGKVAGLEVDYTIVQANEVHRTGSNSWHRFAFRPEFSGAVQQGRKYIIVDDVFAQGGSFSELRRYIEARGGQVVQAAALALAGHDAHIALQQSTKKHLVDKYGQKKLQSFCTEVKLYDGNYEALTEPEACALIRASSLDLARDRIFEARQAGKSQDISDIVRGRQTPPGHRHTADPWDR